MDTTLYLIKNSDAIPYSNYKMLDKDSGNPKSILSIQGEEKAKRLSQLPILADLDAVYSSNDVKAIGTAKYLASANNTIIQIDSRLNERKIGLMEGMIAKHFYRNQAQDWDFRLPKGESLNEAKKRIVSSIKNILMFETGNKIAVVAHNTIFTCLLSAWCRVGYNLDDEVILSNNGETLVDGSHNLPMIIEVVFDGTNVKNIRIVDFS